MHGGQRCAWRYLIKPSRGFAPPELDAVAVPLPGIQTRSGHRMLPLRSPLNGFVVSGRKEFPVSHGFPSPDPNICDSENAVLRRLIKDLVKGRGAEGISRRLAKAETSYQRGAELAVAGDLDKAIEHLQEAVRQRPDYLEAYIGLGDALLSARRFASAAEAYQIALSLQPGLPEAHMNLGTALKGCGEYDAAVDAFQKALALKPNYPGAWNNLGFTLQEAGRLDDAISCYRMALSYRPVFLKAHSNLLFALCYHHQVDPKDVYAEHVRWAKLHELPLASKITQHTNPRDPCRRLRVGYLSPDFRRHAVSHFIEPVLAEHDHAAFEVYCYQNHEQVDQVTARLRGYADAWHESARLSDEEVTALIKRDQIDVLVDLAGHTIGNRLLVFARKPAPVQVTYLGYPATTGLVTMDYRLTDRYTDTVGISEQYYTEKLIRLPHSMWCFRPLRAGDVGTLPALTNGFVTFGSLNNVAKVNDEMLKLWARLLRTLPGSRLIIARVPKGSTRERLRENFIQEGISIERLEILGASVSDDLWESTKRRVDIALDSFPYNGTTTTLDALYAGIPVIALIGKTHASRTAYSILCSAGLNSFASDSPDAYLDAAVRLAADVDALAELRRGLRARLGSSPLMDARRFTRNLEAAYRAMWRAWCELNAGVDTAGIG